MSDVVEFLRARYAEAREREQRKRRSIPSAFDRHVVEISVSSDLRQQVIVDGHPYSAEQYFGIATEPAPDTNVLADLDSKLGILDWFDVAGTSPELHSDAWQIMRQVVLLLGVPFADHPDYDERWRPQP
ncbi:DUF6221 family protein [Streptomyces sp. NPDC048200]|uniref:DUF6221 family protein n=1 Tax=Streptomyces sp. NPDC048200 TaxID=3365512 RepID=UPI00371DA130